MMHNNPKLKKDLIAVIDDLEDMNTKDLQAIGDLLAIFNSEKMRSVLKDIAKEVRSP